MINPIKVLYKANLKLKTALHIGCAQKSPVGSIEMMKNGAGEYIIPGTSIAGVFFDTLRDLLILKGNNEEMSFSFARCSADNNVIYLVPQENKNLIKELYPFPKIEKFKLKGNKKKTFFVVLENIYHNDKGKVKDKFKPIFKNIRKYRTNFASPFIFRSVNPLESVEEPEIKIRNRTRIDRETKTADEGHLFSYWEIEPEEVNFEVKIEIDNLSFKNANLDIEKLKKWIKMVFASWKKEGVFLGAHNTSGNGYCKLQDSKQLIIKSEDFVNYIEDNLQYKPITDLPPDIEKRFKTWKICVNMNDEEDGYGTNSLLIKGGVSHKSVAQNVTDGIFINTGERLFIPGSSLKGTISMFLEKYGYKDEYLHKYFGQENEDEKASESQGYIYFPDLIFEEKYNDNKKHLINIERHAEDEFTRAVLGSGKFNEERLFYAKAEGKIRVPIKFYKKNETVKKGIDRTIEFMKQGCDKRLIPLGANGCYPIIKIKEENNGN